MNKGEAHKQYLLARAWHGKGTIARAIAGYRQVLALDPTHADAAMRLGHLLQDNCRFEEALAVFREGLEHHPHESQLHKRFVDVLLLLEGIEAVFRHYRLERVGSRIPYLAPGEPVVCTVLRNERARLPYFLDYYRRLGIRQFFAVDNDSTDGSGAYLNAQEDVCLWRSALPFRESNFGAAWFEPVLRHYASGHWCLIVDADELFCYPDCETRGIAELCRELDRGGAVGMRAVLLDMYSNRSLRETVYQAGERFEDVCPYFDRQHFHSRVDSAGPFSNMPFLYGGVRQRLFGEAGGYILSKVPLVKYRASTILAGGQHWTNAPADRLARETGCLLHFKFFSTFRNYAAAVVANQQDDFHWIEQNREYVRGLGPDGDLTFYDESQSVRFENSEQLVRLGVMQRDPLPPLPEAAVFPRIEPVGEGMPRPRWSVMLTVYRRLDTLGQALQSVLDQARAPEQMQIEVISDGPADPMHAEIEALVRTLGGSRVQFYAHPERAGHPEIFNVCLRRARGEWIHILHDDDWVGPGFYDALDEAGGIAEAGAAFCRHHHVDRQGRVMRLSALEREAAGVIEGWVDRIATLSRVQAASMAVRRAAYEQVGGYCAQARSAFDWEMWQRISVHFRVWFEPRPLAWFRESEATETARLTATGAQIADTLAAMEVAQSYLPAESREKLRWRAREMYALLAIDAAQARWAAGDAAGALANLREAAACSESVEVTNKMRAFLGKI